MASSFETYIKSINDTYHRGNATEYTYRSALEFFMENLESGIEASSDPKHIQCGAPDFIVEKGHVPLGYVETKDIDADLDQIERSEQMRRYLPALHNLILTNYREFRLYVNGERKLILNCADLAANQKLSVHAAAGPALEALFKQFFATETPTVNTPKELAQRLAAVTHFVRDRVADALNSGDPELQSALNQQYRNFVDLLLPALTPAEFADLYAQTITYGLFAAKLSAPATAEFTFEDAYKYLHSNPFMRKLFLEVSEQVEGIAIIQPYFKDIVSLLNRADFNAILADFGRRTRTEDPVVHFYETFLSAYDPKLRESRGVYYTPEPVVQFIVRSVDELLKTRFGKPWGLADPSVKVLDPACGTGTFLYYVINQIHTEMVQTRGQAGQWPQLSKDMLNRIFGFELLLPAYVVSHLKLDLLMQQLGAPLQGTERLKIYLTNTLEESMEKADQFAGFGLNIAQESSEAAKVKRDPEIMVVLGNPPYSANSINSGEWITNLVRDSYYPHDEIKEHNPKLLLDDYVKFIRFGEWRINQTGHGILAFITNHGYLDNPTFRGMRQHLMQTFDEIYVLDLHGNSKKKEVAPDGSKDENVFDIQQGVAILIAIKDKEDNSLIQPTNKISKVFHSSLWGAREKKYSLLNRSTFYNFSWELLALNKPFYLFSPINSEFLNEYESAYKIIDAFPLNSTGIKTHRDDFVIDFDIDNLRSKIKDFRNLRLSDNEIQKKYDLSDSLEWNLHNKRLYFSNLLTWENSFEKCLYRPFDIRNIYYHEQMIDRARIKVMGNFINQQNIGLIATRQVTSKEFGHILCSTNIIEMKTCSHDRGTDFFPLYLYTTPEQTAGTLFAQTETTRRPNLAPAFIEEFSGKLGLAFIQDGQGDLKTTFGPEDIFYYAYAVFHSPTYRSRYAEFLKIDFPRLPLTSDRGLFAALVPLGKELVQLHLLSSAAVENFITTYPVAGGSIVEKVNYVDGHVYINASQYFGGVPAEVWNFKIGGYQVCDKWLKDRKGRALSSEDILHYQRVVVSLQQTIRLMGEVDATIPAWPME